MNTSLFKCSIMVLILFLTFGPVVLAGTEALEIEVEGYAVIQEDLASALDIAVRDAIRRGIEQALGSYIDSHTLVSNFGLVEDSILSKSTGYVSSYSIQSQVIEDGLVTVVVIMLVQQGQLQNDLDALALGILRKGNPRVAVVLVEERHGQLFPGSLAQMTVIESLVRHGFLVTTNQAGPTPSLGSIREALAGNRSSIEELQRAFNADLLVLGTTSAVPVANVHGVLSYRGAVEVKIIDLATGNIIASGHTSEVGLDVHASGAAEKSMILASEAMAEFVVSNLAQRVIAQDNVVSLEVEGITFTDLMSMENRLKSTRLTNSVFIRSFDGGRAEVEVSTGLTALQLAGEISNFRLLNLNFEIESVVGNRLVIVKN